MTILTEGYPDHSEILQLRDELLNYQVKKPTNHFLKYLDLTWTRINESMLGVLMIRNMEKVEFDRVNIKEKLVWLEMGVMKKSAIFRLNSTEEEMEKINEEANKMDLIDGKATNMRRTIAYTVPDNAEEQNNMMKLLSTQEEADDFEEGEDLEVEKKRMKRI